MKSIQKLLSEIRKADQEYNLIEDGDKICVGISGGKDSSTLLYCLMQYQKFGLKKFEIVPIYCHMNFSETNIHELIDYYDKLGIKIIYYPTQIADILNLHLQNGKLQCSLCARLRHGAIINAAKEYGCNKLAFGHHSDDAVETLFMNMMHGGRISTFQPDTYLEKQGIHLIRPLVFCYENDIKKAAADLCFPIVKSGCTNDGNTERQVIKDMLNQMYHDHKCRDNFRLMLRNTQQLQIFEKKEK